MTRTTLTKVALTAALCLFALLVVAGGVATATLYPVWVALAYGAGSVWFGFTVGEALGEIWTVKA